MMFSSSIFILSFVGVVNFALSAANHGQHYNGHLQTEKTPNGGNINIANGVGKTNEVRLTDRQEDSNCLNAEQYLNLLQAMLHVRTRNHVYPPTPTTKPQTTPKPEESQWHSSISNVGNGFGNTNILVTEPGDCKVSATKSAHTNGYSGGTSFVHNRSDGVDRFIGYGSNNQNSIVYINLPTKPDSTGSKPSAVHEALDQLINMKQIADELQGIVTELIQQQQTCICQD